METDAGKLEPRPAAVRPLFAQPHTADLLLCWASRLALRDALSALSIPSFVHRIAAASRVLSSSFPTLLSAVRHGGTEARRVLHMMRTTSCKTQPLPLFRLLIIFRCIKACVSEIRGRVQFALVSSNLPRGNFWPQLSLLATRLLLVHASPK